MDRLSTDILTAICNYLPWTDRLVSLQLADRFRSLNSRKLVLGVLTIRKEGQTFSFTMKYQIRGWEYQIIEIVCDENIAGTAPGYQQSKAAERKGPDIFRKRIIRCPSSRHCQFVCAYMQYFSSFFHVQVLQLVRLDSDYLIKIDEEVQQKGSHLHWVFDQFELYPCNSELSIGERKFLERFKSPFCLVISSPLNFILPDDFWKIAAVSGTVHLILDYGREEPPADGYSATLDTRRTDVKLLLGDEIVKQLVEDKKASFIVNTVTNISADFILEYIKNAFSLKHAMYTLSFQHNYDENEVLRMQGWLKANGFVEISGGGVAKNIGTRTKKGFVPDRIIMTINKQCVLIEADYACYRGEKTMRDPNHPMLNFDYYY